MAMAAKIPMIATTIINSMRVKPSCFRNGFRNASTSYCLLVDGSLTARHILASFLSELMSDFCYLTL